MNDDDVRSLRRELADFETAHGDRIRAAYKVRFEAAEQMVEAGETGRSVWRFVDPDAPTLPEAVALVELDRAGLGFTDPRDWSAAEMLVEPPVDGEA